MIIDDIRELIKEGSEHLAIITQFVLNSRLEETVNTLTQTIEAENFWQNKESVAILQEHQNKKQLLIEYQTLSKNMLNTKELVEMLVEQNDETELALLLNETHELIRSIKKFKLYILLQDQYDSHNCFVDINSGAGGTESQDWAEMLLRMCIRFAEREHMKASVLDLQPGEGAGIKSATLYIQKKYAYGLLRAESGVHRLVRISPFDSNKRRHTSFASITVTPEIDEGAIQINPEDLKIDTYRAGGAGGQHVNKTESAVRITHIPTGLIAQCQNERSQMQNKQTALKMLAAKLAEQQELERKATHEKITDRKKIEWGSQIRSYVLHPYKMVKDHRTDIESHNPDDVLDGNLMPFIEAYLTQTS